MLPATEDKMNQAEALAKSLMTENATTTLNFELARKVAICNVK